ncbi:VOC family protein [Roseomonas sp. KE0001]|uniref:VOC family protein n=1 Tax=Roseomonas sp. KE0001 TaxID=2479201 RepID=UPI0018DF4B25|nr:VOC family protein [Roseomonas sp. KE0001]MBI0435443.1 VOC family protein [Roseomonas sp. KE0001]
MSRATVPLPGIDHPLILMRDIEAGRAFYARLGFTVTPVGRHPWGTSTALAVLERSALELMGIYDESLIDGLETGGFRFGRHMRDALAEREGMALVALHSRDVSGDGAAMAGRGIATQGRIDFRRKVKPPGLDWDEAVVSLQILLDPALPRVSHFLAQQHKPHLLWVPDWMRHANGATHVAAVTYLAEDPAPVCARLGRMFGGGPAAFAAEFPTEFPTGQGHFRVLRPADWPAAFGATPMPRLTPGEPGGAAIDVAVRDLAVARAVLAGAGVATVETAAGPAIADVAGCGNVVIRFVRACAGAAGRGA